MKSKKINTDSKKKIEFGTAAVAEVFYNYPERMRTKLLFLRQLIFDTASMTESIGPLEETLKWGEPSYLTTQTKSGSTIRIHHRESRADEYGIYFNCKTTLIEQFKRNTAISSASKEIGASFLNTTSLSLLPNYKIASL